MGRTFTGRHMAMIMVGFFGVIIAVNFTMARFATATFGGIVVENSYVASQEFNGWLEEAEKQRALGWDAVTTWRPDNRLAVQLSSVPAGATVADVWRGLVAEFPEMARYEASVSSAVNADYARMTAVVSDGDEVAFLPPVSGG